MFDQLKKEIRKFFGISKTEVNGILLLLISIIFLCILPFVYTPVLNLYNSKKPMDIHYLDSMLMVMEKSGYFGKEEVISDETGYAHLFQFNPNEIAYDSLVLLGFNPVIAKRIIKYRNSGGKFQIKADLKKIYDLNDSIFNALIDWIELPEAHKGGRIDSENREEITKTTANIPVKEDKMEIVEWIPSDLNTMDSTELMKIKGIGKVFSSRIIKYRNLLGGYVSLDQLNEVYGLTDEAINHLKPAVYIDSLFNARHLKINFATWNELIKHPYINSKMANTIINSRSSIGPINNANDLFKINGLEDSILMRVERYLIY